MGFIRERVGNLTSGEPNMTKDEAIVLLQKGGYWSPLPGVKASRFPYKDAVAFAVDDTTKKVYAINDVRDIKTFEAGDGSLERAISEGRCDPALAGHKFVVVRK